TRSVERGGGSLGGRGGLAQRYGLARASCDLAPDDGGLKKPLRAVPGPHPAGGDVRRLAFAAQQGELEELQKRLVPAGQPIPQGPDGLGAEQPLKLTPELEHAPNSGNPDPSHRGTSSGRSPGDEQSRSRAPLTSR